MEMLNFDCAASAPVLPIAMAAFLSAPAGNPNAGHAIGRAARDALENARHDIAECIGAEAKEILFTPSATAACRFAVELFSITLPNNRDHKAAFDAVCARKWLMEVCGDTPGSGYISIPYASNETGEFFDKKIMNLQHFGDDDVFTDATAAMGHCRIDVKELGVVALAAGAHKFGGIPGIGFLYVRGGFAERDARDAIDHTFPGTPPVALACAMAAALRYRMENLGLAEELFHRRTAFAQMLRDGLPGAVEINTPFYAVPTILSVRFDGVNARELLTAMEVRGLCASAGSACSSGSDEPSRQLLAAGLTPEQALSTVRFSFTEETSMADFHAAASIVSESVLALRPLG